jgi:hypothetical protein
MKVNVIKPPINSQIKPPITVPMLEISTHAEITAEQDGPFSVNQVGGLHLTCNDSGTVAPDMASQCGCRQVGGCVGGGEGVCVCVCVQNLKGGELDERTCNEKKLCSNPCLDTGCV